MQALWFPVSFSLCHFHHVCCWFWGSSFSSICSHQISPVTLFLEVVAEQEKDLSGSHILGLQRMGLCISWVWEHLLLKNIVDSA